jgi:aminopeptidase-like protein
MIGKKMHDLAKRLFPINRSLTGKGVVETLNILKEYNPNLEIHSIKSGSKVFDWEVPDEWNCEEAYIITPDGEKICDYNQNNLHLVQYSIPVEKEVSLEELQEHLYSLEKLPDAIPYVTSYYNKKWGFCIADKDRKNLKKGTYKVIIKSELKKGVLHYANIIIPGKIKEEIMFSTYICHPSMANNELSGPILATFLAKELRKKENYYTYRFIFAPETIGSLVYMSDKLKYLKKYVKAGFILTCVGDERNYSYLKSRYGDTLADKVAQNILKYKIKNYNEYSFLERGSDERQYCAPGIDLPVCSVMRSKYATYPEYHTSLDNLDLITPKGLEDSFNLYKNIIDTLENNFYYKTTVLGEPQLGKRGLYPTECTPSTNYTQAFLYRNILAYADGKNDLIDIANILKVDAVSLIPIIKLFLEHNLLEIN